MQQLSLFANQPELPAIAGLRYESEFLSDSEETSLIALLRTLPLEAARYRQFVARRRVLSFGGHYDFDANRLLPSPTLDERLHSLRDKVAAWLSVPAASLVHTLVAEYSPGTPLGWHRDVPDFETIAGISLGSVAELRFRPYPPSPLGSRHALRLLAAPRSIYEMSREARWQWQHSVMPTPALRWSVTFRTMRDRRLHRGVP